MDYSLLLGIHDVLRAEQEEDEDLKEEEEEGEDVMAVGSYGTSPEGIGGYLNSYKPLGPGEFDPYVDVYAIKSAEGEWGWQQHAGGAGFWGWVALFLPHWLAKKGFKGWEPPALAFGDGFSPNASKMGPQPWALARSTLCGRWVAWPFAAASGPGGGNGDGQGAC